jgi:hypothetical protein
MKGVLLTAALCLAASPAAATEWVYCSDPTSTVTVGLLLGATDVLSVSGIILSHDNDVWASAAAYGPGEPVSLGQGFADGAHLSVDLMDGDFALLAELRLVKSEEGMEFVQAGTLRLPGRGVWSVSCEGP